MVWWGICTWLCYKFPTESNSERILKIGKYLVKVWARVRCLVFLTHSVDRKPHQYIITRFLQAGCSSWHPTNSVQAPLKAIHMMIWNAEKWKLDTAVIKAYWKVWSKLHVACRIVKRWLNESNRSCYAASTNCGGQTFETSGLKWAQNSSRKSASEMTYTVSSGALNSTPTPRSIIRAHRHV